MLYLLFLEVYILVIYAKDIIVYKFDYHVKIYVISFYKFFVHIQIYQMVCVIIF
jgi:hypothetical protein